ncbi:zinc-dependent metalloprotease [Muricauda sp. 334s03]|uniref:Zinc-dependent metalloprotease n=1 Tax=Flagellimonas yonaguniensis TaxID=3031325 RepID=A0ABT5XY03_9FLAO|nr:zinc-dependent metalloprotease [[Muricauda] yonaguniensis]MDF0716066.1 zinc-dependent metalloprotease [[Muricauda] yonaguniensis]
MKHIKLPLMLLFLFFGQFEASPINLEIKTNLDSDHSPVFFTTEIVGEQLFLNIPDNLLDQPILFNCNKGRSYSYMQIAWTRHRDNIILKSLSVPSTSGVILPVVTDRTLMDNVLAIFPLEQQQSESKGYRIDITDLILNKIVEWPQNLGVSFGPSIPDISFVEDSKDRDNEVIIKVRRGMVSKKEKVSFPMYFGFSALPEPMKSRTHDYRMGYFNEDYMGIPQGIHVRGTHNSKANIIRWRLNKKYRDKNLSVPIKPITFLLSPEIPKKWRPYVKAGIEEWLPAFETAGFNDAIRVIETDSLSEWDKYSVNTNIVYWGQERYFRNPDGEEYGGTVRWVIDDRTGEILKGDVFLNASRETLEERYFIRAAPLDKRARSFPFPDELTGRLFQALTAHETGHALGLKDGNYGEYSYSVDQVTDPNWLTTMGHTPSVMNYTRHNSIPQPKDNIPPNLLIPKVGPADHYSITWGYREFPSGTTKEEESQLLEAMIRSQDSIPWYRYNDSQFEVIGPARTDEVVETHDPVRSTSMALRNVERAITMIHSATLNEKGNARLFRLYNKSVVLWYDHMKHVASVIGGYDLQYKSLGQPGNMFDPIAWSKQEKAIDFLIQNAFQPPKWLTDPDFMVKVRYTTFPDKVSEYQIKLMTELLLAPRLKRLEYMQGLMGNNLLEQFLVKVQEGLFTNLDNEKDLSPRMQELQMAYIERLGAILNIETSVYNSDAQLIDYTDYAKGLLSERLLELKTKLEKKVNKGRRTQVNGHWLLCLQKINTILP